MTPHQFAALVAARKARSLPMTWAVIADIRRRGGVRVARCRVTSDFAPMAAAAVEELRTSTPHVLPYGRLSKAAGYLLGRKVRRFIALTAPDEKSAVAEPLAGAGAG